MLTSGLLQVEIDSMRIHYGNQDVDILRRDVKYLQDELGNAEWQTIKQHRGAWSDEDVQNSLRLKIQEIMDFENESKSLLRRIYELFHPNMWMAMIITCQIRFKECLQMITMRLIDSGTTIFVYF